jgi:carbonic anhydrase/acetyltransferase-like protein (isoleucine patch superfamily)
VVLEGHKIPPRSFVAGVLATVRGAIPAAALARLRESADAYVALAGEHAALVPGASGS